MGVGRVGAGFSGVRPASRRSPATRARPRGHGLAGKVLATPSQSRGLGPATRARPRGLAPVTRHGLPRQQLGDAADAASAPRAGAVDALTHATVGSPAATASRIAPALTPLHQHTVASAANGSATTDMPASGASSRSSDERSAGSSEPRSNSRVSSAPVRGIPTETKPVRTPSTVTSLTYAPRAGSAQRVTCGPWHSGACEKGSASTAPPATTSMPSAFSMTTPGRSAGTGAADATAPADAPPEPLAAKARPRVPRRATRGEARPRVPRRSYSRRGPRPRTPRRNR